MTSSNYTLAELKEKKAAWLLENKRFVKDAVLVARELGQPVDVLEVQLVRRKWKSGDLVLFYEHKVLNRSLRRNEWQTCDTVIVSLGGDYVARADGILVCRVQGTNFGTVQGADDFFVPGDWKEVIRAVVPDAQAIVDKRVAAAEAAECAKLLNQLQHGVLWN